MMRCIVLSSSLWKTKAVNLGGSGAKPPICLTLAVATRTSSFGHASRQSSVNLRRLLRDKLR